MIEKCRIGRLGNSSIITLPRQAFSSDGGPQPLGFVHTQWITKELKLSNPVFRGFVYIPNTTLYNERDYLKEIISFVFHNNYNYI